MIFPQHLEEIGHITPIDPEDLAAMRDKVLLQDPEPRYGALGPALAKLSQLVNLAAEVYVPPHESVTKDGHPYHVKGYWRKNPFAGIESAKRSLDYGMQASPVGLDSTMEITAELYGEFWGELGNTLFDSSGGGPHPEGFDASLIDAISVEDLPPPTPDQATPDEVAAYMSWASVEGYMAMQDLLRGTSNSDRLPRFQAHWNPRQTPATYAPQVEILKKAIARAPVTPEPMAVFRGFSQRQFGKLRAGQVVRDPGFVATITSIDYAKAYDEHGQPQALAEILLPAGTHAIGRNGEITLPPGSRFRVLGTERISDGAFVEPGHNPMYDEPGPDGEPSIATKFRTIVRMELISP